MLGAMLSNAGFKCCVCAGAHRQLNGGLKPAQECFFALVREAGGNAPTSRKHRRGYSPGGPATASWESQVLSKAVWPDNFRLVRTLLLADYKHALAADTKDAGLAFIKGIIEDWEKRNWNEEQEAWLTSAAPESVKCVDKYGGLFVSNEGVDAALSDVKTATLLMKDASVGRLLSSIAHTSACVAFEWLDVTKPAKLLLEIRGDSDKEDLTGVYLFTKENRLQFIPKKVKTIKEAEEALKQDLLTKLSGKL